MVFLCRQVRRQNTSFNFAKRWHFRSPFLSVCCRVVGRPTLATNGLALGEEAVFEALNCLPALNLIRRTKLHLTTEPAFLPNACYSLWFLSFRVCWYMLFFTIIFNFCVVCKIVVTKFVKFFFCSRNIFFTCSH